VVEGDRVRIVKLAKRLRAKVGPGAPQAGQVGTIRYVVHDSQGNLSGYIVEHVRPNGAFAWTADFMADEVEAAN